MLGELTILLYHGVTDSKSFGIENYHSKHIPVSDFKKQMKFLSEKCNVLSMDEVVHHYVSKEPFPAKAVAVTFDDGFENNYLKAAPILSEFGIKTTFYITSGIVDSEKMFWVDELEDCINLSPHRFIQVHLNEPHYFDISTRNKKIEALEAVKTYCKSVTVSQKDNIVQQIKFETGVHPSVENAVNYRKITLRQLREMYSDSLFTIGGHSFRHNILSKFDNQEEMKADIVSSIAQLETMLRTSIKHYAYPEGQPDHFNSSVISELKSNGIVCCPTAIHGVNTGEEDLFSLKRIMVGFKGTPFPFYSGEKQSAVFA
jgi:peptidoglycan/xylan/chitin deacetylase (PgdA/CDA1 family)